MRPPRNPIQPSDKTFGSPERPESPQLEYADPPEDNGPPDIDSEEEILPPDNGGNPPGPPDGDDDPTVVTQGVITLIILRPRADPRT